MFYQHHLFAHMLKTHYNDLALGLSCMIGASILGLWMTVGGTKRSFLSMPWRVGSPSVEGEAGWGALCDIPTNCSRTSAPPQMMVPPALVTSQWSLMWHLRFVLSAFFSTASACKSAKILAPNPPIHKLSHPKPEAAGQQFGWDFPIDPHVSRSQSFRSHQLHGRIIEFCTSSSRSLCIRPNPKCIKTNPLMKSQISC